MKSGLTNFLVPMAVILLPVSSCDKKEVPQEVAPPVPKVVEPVTYEGEKAVEVREKTVIELLAIKKGVQGMIGSQNQREDLSIDKLIRELESLRPKLARIHRETARLPKEEQMVVYGNLAVASNQLEKDLVGSFGDTTGER